MISLAPRSGERVGRGEDEEARIFIVRIAITAIVGLFPSYR